jgi:hypothetical protein
MISIFQRIALHECFMFKRIRVPTFPRRANEHHDSAPLAGKSALVTGAARNLGAEIVLTFLRDSYRRKWVVSANDTDSIDPVVLFPLDYGCNTCDRCPPQHVNASKNKRAELLR